MQTLPYPNSIPSTEFAPVTQHSAWRRAGAALCAALLIGGCAKGANYDTSNLASAPHDAEVVLQVGTVIAFEESEGRECKTKSLTHSVGEIALANATPTPKATKTPRKSPSPRKVTSCEGAEIQVEACQTGAAPDSNPGTATTNCAHVDLTPQEFIAATGTEDVTDNQQFTTKTQVIGTIDRD